MNRLALAVTLAFALTPLSAPAQIAPLDPLAEALAMVAKRDWPRATEIAAPLNPVARDLVEWHRLRAGEGNLGEYEDFLRRRPDWPGLAQIRSRGEVAVARSITPSRVLAWYDKRDAATPEGLLAQVRALKAQDQTAKAAEVVGRLWVGMTLKPEEQSKLTAELGALLTPKLHQVRMDNLLWTGRFAEARQMLPLVSPDWAKLAEARMALRENRDGVDSYLAAVPASLADDAGLAHARFEWRARKDRFDGAVEILRARSTSAEALGRPESWAGRRASLARTAMREGKGALAYELASNHHMTRRADVADAEFLSGFIALKALKDPAKALLHFQKINEVVSTPISLSRGDYWQGRALKALGREAEATAAFTRAAQHQTAYYGLLAAEELGLGFAPELSSPPRLANWRQSSFLKSSVTEAALLAWHAGDNALARRFMLHLAEGRSAEELEAMGAFAMEKGDVHLAVLIGKQAASRGIILPAIYFPEPSGLVPDGLAVERPLALAIARRESEFRVDAVSPVGALGLMQLMPGTAKMMAAKVGIEDRQSALTQDPGYNARLGSAYLAHLAEEFGPSIALRAAGYNAGPGRPRAWVQTYGDPRDPQTDVVDWVEMVPFNETRTYIMRVAEGVAIYDARRNPQAKVAITPLLRGQVSQ